MCGIAAVLRPQGVPPEHLRRMADRLRHRGPDGHGYAWLDAERGIQLDHDDSAPRRANASKVALAHRRLSILDLSEDAAQPMVDETGTYALTYNGEIYNYVELRSELERRGHRLRSSGDTEVFLRSYIEWGASCVERFVGMWTAVILDLRRRVLFISRDRFGIKPLFYAIADGGLWLASEIKALLEIAAVPRAVDEVTLATYLVEGIVDHSSATFFRGIRQVPAAHNAQVPLDEPVREPRFTRYWEIPDGPRETCTASAIERFRSHLSNAVAQHARSDVSVGTCLSGGLDSTGIVCIADDLRRAGEVPQYAHEAFGYVPEEKSVSERDYMAEVVEHSRVRMHYVEVPHERFIAKIGDIIAQQDEPVGSASIAAQWFVFESARHAGIKVMLDGQGADEVLAGYQDYNRIMAEMLIRQGRFREYGRFDRSHRARFGTPPLQVRALAGALMASPRARRLPIAGRAMDWRAPAWLNAGRLPSEYTAGRDARAVPPGSLHELLKTQTKSMNLPALLRYEDRNSMAHSIEARVPYLDHRLVEVAFELDDACKLHGATSKYVLREALRGTIPERVRTRVDKIGFRADPGVTAALARRPDVAFLSAPTDIEQRWLNTDGVRRLLVESGESVAAEFALWRVLNAKLWLRSLEADSSP
jgi:asparagine synthase (glutamine-hydrolysing)